MIKSGLCSITFRQLSAGEIVALAAKAGLEGIEWAGDVHVPHGDIAAARSAGEKTRSAGLEACSYGSYYRVGVSEDRGLSFGSVLETAVALGAPAIRVWAGNKDSAQAGEDLFRRIVAETFRIADMAHRAGATICFEFHGGTLTDRGTSAVEFASQVQHDAVRFSWQPPHGYTLEDCLAGLRGLLERLGNVHVFHWTIGSPDRNTVTPDVRPLKYPEDFHRHLLADGEDRWSAYLEAIRSSQRDHTALLEFVKDDDPENFFRDAQTLKRLIGRP